MNRFIIISILAALLIGFVILEQLYIDNTIAALKAQADGLKTAIVAKDMTESKTKAEKLKTYWDEKERVICIIIDHKETTDIGRQINLVLSNLNRADFPQALVECNLLIHYIEGHSSILNFDFNNIM